MEERRSTFLVTSYVFLQAETERLIPRNAKPLFGECMFQIWNEDKSEGGSAQTHGWLSLVTKGAKTPYSID